MTLLSICQDACNYAPVAAPAAIIGNADQTAILALAAAQQEGQALARKPQGGWVSMIQPYELATQASGNFTGNAVNLSTTGPIQITITTGGSGNSFLEALDPTWIATGTGLPNNAVVASMSRVAPPFIYTITIQAPLVATGAPITGGQYNFSRTDYPLPADFQRPIDNTFWDRTRYWAMRGPLSPQQWQLYRSSVIGKATIQRRYRFRQVTVGGTHRMMLSIDPVPTDNGSYLIFEYVSNAWCQSASGALQSSWQADTDTGILDEYLMQLGVRWRLLRRLGLAYDEEKDEYDTLVAKAVANDGGAAILDMTPSEHLTLLGPWNIPETGFGNVLS